MALYVTEIRAIKPSTGELTTFCGPEVPGISEEDAQNYCENNGLGYCKVLGRLVAEIPCKEDEDGYPYSPDWDNAIDYDLPTNN